MVAEAAGVGGAMPVEAAGAAQLPSAAVLAAAGMHGRDRHLGGASASQRRTGPNVAWPRAGCRTIPGRSGVD